MPYTEDNPRYHLVKMRGMLNAVMRHCREDSGKIAEQKTQALLDTTAEVLNGLITTYSRYEAELEEKDRRLAA
jgi:hypothetical protein